MPAVTRPTQRTHPHHSLQSRAQPTASLSQRRLTRVFSNLLLPAHAAPPSGGLYAAVAAPAGGALAAVYAAAVWEASGG